MGMGCPPFLPARRVWGSFVSSSSGIWGGAPAASDFNAFHVQFYAISRMHFLVNLTAA